MIRIRPMTVDDLPAGLRLSRQAGWNQAEADWRRFLDLQPDGGFVAELEAQPVGTVVTIRFYHVAWVAMVASLPPFGAWPDGSLARRRVG